MIHHWCQKGHIVICLEGEFIREMTSGEQITLTAGGTYVVSDDLSSHRSMTERGVLLLFMDGDFLKNRKLLYLIAENEPLLMVVLLE